MTTFSTQHDTTGTAPAPPNQSPDPACMSYYLALRHLPRAGLQWRPGVAPALPASRPHRALVSTSDDILDGLVASTPRDGGTGLLLSGGIDSAILAALVPPETPCFTIAFDAPGAVDESVRAAAYAARWGHSHHVIRVRWSDYLAHAGPLMATKRAPLHAVEVPLHLAARRARSLGVTTLVVGNGADSNFGGMDKLLAHDWTFGAFVERYRFADPAAFLAEPVDITDVFEPYRRGISIDMQGFLHDVHGQGIVQAFENAVHGAGVQIAAPYETLRHDGPLDLERIRSGEPKYLVQEAFRLLYDTEEVPAKVPFARPLDAWMADWTGPLGRPEYREDITAQLVGATGETRWLVWCLAAFLDQLDGRDGLGA